MARALVLGESDLAAGDDAAFRTSGLSHLLAVSGMHLVLVVLTLVHLLRAHSRSGSSGSPFGIDVGRVAAACGIPLAWIYAELAGGSGSTLRAAWMLTFALLARTLARRPDGPRAFALSLRWSWRSIDPLVAFDLSFLLSAAATAGLLILATPLAESVVIARAPRAPRRRSRHRDDAGGVHPLRARPRAFAPTVPMGGVVANLLAVPVGELAALPLCLAHGVLSPWPDAERGCAVACVRRARRGPCDRPALLDAVAHLSRAAARRRGSSRGSSSLVAAFVLRRGLSRALAASAAAIAILLLEISARRGRRA